MWGVRVPWDEIDSLNVAFSRIKRELIRPLFDYSRVSLTLVPIHDVDMRVVKDTYVVEVHIRNTEDANQLPIQLFEYKFLGSHYQLASAVVSSSSVPAITTSSASLPAIPAAASVDADNAIATATPEVMANYMLMQRMGLHTSSSLLTTSSNASSALLRTLASTLYNSKQLNSVDSVGAGGEWRYAIRMPNGTMDISQDMAMNIGFIRARQRDLGLHTLVPFWHDLSDTFFPDLRHEEITFIVCELQRRALLWNRSATAAVTAAGGAGGLSSSSFSDSEKLSQLLVSLVAPRIASATAPAAASHAQVGEHASTAANALFSPVISSTVPTATAGTMSPMSSAIASASSASSSSPPTLASAPGSGPREGVVANASLSESTDGIGCSVRTSSERLALTSPETSLAPTQSLTFTPASLSLFRNQNDPFALSANNSRGVGDAAAAPPALAAFRSVPESAAAAVARTGAVFDIIVGTATIVSSAAFASNPSSVSSAGGASVYLSAAADLSSVVGLRPLAPANVVDSHQSPATVAGVAPLPADSTTLGARRSSFLQPNSNNDMAFGSGTSGVSDTPASLAGAGGSAGSAILRYSVLFVLGEPGTGKTEFARYLGKLLAPVYPDFQASFLAKLFLTHLSGGLRLSVVRFLSEQHTHAHRQTDTHTHTHRHAHRHAHP